MLVRSYASPTDAEFLTDLKQSLEILGCFTKVETGSTNILTCSIDEQPVVSLYSTYISPYTYVAAGTAIYSASGTMMHRNEHYRSGYDSVVYLYSTGQYVLLEFTCSNNHDNQGSLIRFHIFTKDKHNNPIVFFRYYIRQLNFDCSNMNIFNLKKGVADYFNVQVLDHNNAWPSGDKRPYSLTTSYVVLGDDGYESLPDIYAIVRRQESIDQQYNFSGMEDYRYKPPSELIIDGTPYITNGEVLLKA